MNQLKRVSIISIFLTIISVFNVSCFRSNRGVNLSSTIQNESQISEHLNNSMSSFVFQSESLENLGEELANNIANGIVSALEKDSPSFLQDGTGFDIKGQIKKHAKDVLKEVVKAGILPVEQIIAESVKPPTMSNHAYALLKPVLKTLFNKIEDSVKTDVPDSIWDIGEEEEREEDFDDLADELISE